MLRPTILVLSLALGAGLVPPDKTAELRSRFVKEANPVKKAKILPQLADAEYLQVQEQLKADNAAEAGAIVKQMAEEAAAAQAALDAKVRDPEEHPQGYRELQISVRQTVRRIDNILVGLSLDEQTPFQEARSQLDELDRKLLHELFPKRPDAADQPAPPAPNAPKP
jgi:polyhydroxyalkanoate synthesis regulator phasin